MDNCKDTWKNPSLCELWAEYQHCVINPSFMLKSCAKSCRSCTAGMYLLSIDLIYNVTNYKITRWPLYCLSFHLWLLITPLYCLFFYLWLLITPLYCLFFHLWLLITPLYCLFFYLWLLMTHLVSSNLSY